MSTENTQAGAVAVLHRNDAGQIYWTTSVPFPELPLGVYVPVEALEGLVVQLELLRHTADQSGRREDALFARGITAAITELTQLIKERSNG